MNRIYRPADTLAREHTEVAIQTIADVMVDPFAENKDRLSAAKEILDRGHGKPMQAIIQVPASKAVAARLAALSGDELLEIMNRPLPRLAAPIEGECVEVAERDPLLE